MEFDILALAANVTAAVPFDVGTFFSREQLMGALKEKQQQFDSFGELRQSLLEHKHKLEERQQK